MFVYCNDYIICVCCVLLFVYSCLWYIVYVKSWCSSMVLGSPCIRGRLVHTIMEWRISLQKIFMAICVRYVLTLYQLLSQSLSIINISAICTSYPSSTNNNNNNNNNITTTQTSRLQQSLHKRISIRRIRRQRRMRDDIMAKRRWIGNIRYYKWTTVFKL